MNLAGLVYFVHTRINAARAKLGLDPLRCVKVVDKTDFAHVYEDDWTEALRVVVLAQTYNERVFG
jgi:hypothetical protein